MIAGLSDDKYGILISLIGVALGTKRALDSHLNYVLNSNVSFVAINFESCTTEKMSKYWITALYGKANICHKFFTSEIEAKKWLTNKLSLKK